MTALKRRTVLRAGVSVTVAVLGVQPVAAEPLDGKGNDVCPCFFDVSETVLRGDDTIEVSGPCSVANPPETVTVRVQIRGDGGARAIGSDTFDCAGSPADRARFTLTAPVRSPDRFAVGTPVDVRATVHVRPDAEPTITGRWNWSGTLAGPSQD